MSDGLYLDDGFTRTKTIPAEKGMHPAAVVVYRPAVARERHAYTAKLGTKDPAQIDAFETDLILRHVVSVNGRELKAAEREKDRARDLVRRLHPDVQLWLIDLVLSFRPGDEPDAEHTPEDGASF